MAFDVYAFDLFAVPRDRYDFLDWVSRGFRTIDGSNGNPSSLPPALQAWLKEMTQSFPASNMNSRNFDMQDSSKTASYRFATGIIQAGFDWDASGPALYRAKRTAERCGVGLYEASSHEGAVWMVSQRGRWEIVHRNDDGRRSLG
jgi:hypothetical protein